jgi:hypothetical protein
MASKVRIVVVVWVLIVSGIVTGVWVLMEDIIAKTNPEILRIMPRLSDWRGFLSAGVGNTNHIGDHLAITLVMAILFFIYARKKSREIILLFSILIIGAGLFICWSVGSNLGLVVGIVIMLIMLLHFEFQGFVKRRWKRLAALVCVSLFIMLFFLTPQPLNPHKPSIWKEAFGSARWHAGGPTRLAIWLNSLEIIRHNVILGVGEGNFTYAYSQTISPLLLGNHKLTPYAGLYTNAAHNMILQTWAERGIVSVAAQIFLIAAFFWLVAKELPGSSRVNYFIRVGLIVSMATFVVQAQMNFIFQLPASLVLFFTLIAIPGAMMDKSRFPHGSIIPVEVQRGPLAFEVHMTGMQKPEYVRIGLRPIPLAGRIIGFVIILVVIGWCGVNAIRPLASDIVYKNARNHMAIGNKTQAEEKFKKAIALWPDHADCRSAYSTFLLDEERYEETIEQVEKLQEKLQASETFYRLGLAYFKLGQEDKAAENWIIFFTRLPRAQYMPQYQGQFQWVQEYLLKKEASS